MSGTAILYSMLTGAGMLLLSDLVGYATSYKQWMDLSAKDPFGYAITPPPPFHWPLFAVRIAIGLIGGALGGVGISNYVTTFSGGQ